MVRNVLGGELGERPSGKEPRVRTSSTPEESSQKAVTVDFQAVMEFIGDMKGEMKAEMREMSGELISWKKKRHFRGTIENTNQGIWNRGHWRGRDVCD